MNVMGTTIRHHHQHHLQQQQQQQQQLQIKESNLKRSFVKSNVNVYTGGKKKHVKFAKSSLAVSTSAPRKFSFSSPPSLLRKSPQSNQHQKFNKYTTQRLLTPDPAAAAPAEEAPAFYYYYYYPTDESAPALQVPLSEEQQYYYNNAGNYYYYAIDGALDANYNEYLIQPASETYQPQQQQQPISTLR
jgi:hypothetical protein